jgi:polysaccharide pyruvyl transferase WcaK-like protein
MSKRLVLFDPALKNNEGEKSDNLGDVIISQSVFKYLSELFPEVEIIKISTHSFMRKREYDIVKRSKLAFLGGSNILSSNIRIYNQWKLSDTKYYYLFPKVNRIITLGVGWWQYQSDPSFFTKLFYNKVFDKEKIHSVRDNYTREMLLKGGIKKVINTSCPTTWELNGINPNRKSTKIDNCLFTLTDYNRHEEYDSKLIEVLLEFYSGKILFFPQGALDKEYLESLKIYKDNRSRIYILDRSINEFISVMSADVNYIGTRLHGGIKCMQTGMDSLIVSVDNRAKEIGKDINLPVVERNDFDTLKRWLKGNPVFKVIQSPIQDIQTWKDQFSNS